MGIDTRAFSPFRGWILSLLAASAVSAGALVQAGCGASAGGVDAVAQAANATSTQDTVRLHETTSISVAGRSFKLASAGGRTRGGGSPT